MAKDVAEYVVYLASNGPGIEIEEGSDTNSKSVENLAEGITHLKLQKILYFIQAYFLSNLDHPAFKEEIEAWQYGPVVREIYEIYKNKGNRPILSPHNSSEPDTFKTADKKAIKLVWEYFGKYSAFALVDMTHGHLPWKEAHETPTKIITHEAIKKFYSSD